MSSSTHSWEYFSPVGHRYPIEDRAALELGTHLPKKQPLPDVLTPRECQLTRYTPKYPSPSIGELWYFPLRARRESVAMVLHYAGLSYSLRTVTFDEWTTLKPEMPNGKLPQFVPLDLNERGDFLSETHDIMKHVCKLAPHMPGLLPADAAGAATAEKIFTMCNGSGPINKLDPIVNFFPAEEAAPQVKDAIKAAIAEFKKIEATLKQNGPFFCGAAPCYFEFTVFHYLNLMKLLDPSVLTTLGEPWGKFYAAVEALPGIKQYLKSRPKAGSGKVGMPGSLIVTKLSEADA